MAYSGERVTDVACTEDKLIVDLADGRSISVPLAWYPRLLHATPQERDNWDIAGAGFGIHWPDIDEEQVLALRPGNFGRLNAWSA